MAVIPSQDTRPPASFPKAAKHDLEAADISSCHLYKELHILHDWLFSEAKEKGPNRAGWLGEHRPGIKTGLSVRREERWVPLRMAWHKLGTHLGRRSHHLSDRHISPWAPARHQDTEQCDSAPAPTPSPVGRPLETALLRVKSGQGAQEWRAGLYLGGRRGRPGSQEGRVAGGQTAGPDPEGLPGAEGFSLRFHKDQPRPRDTK